jgi:arylsulfatase A-like enzyme
MKTPNIDRLAAEGVLFNNAYCNIPVCGASRASIMSGMRGTSTRFVNWFTKMEEDVPGIPSLPEQFRKNGYRTISLGKLFHHADDCLDSWSISPWRPDQHPGREWSGRGYLNEKSQRLAASGVSGYGPAFEKGDEPQRKYPDEVLADKAIEQLKGLGKSGQPFFLAVGFFKPHLPFNAPAAYWDMYQPSEEFLADNPYRPENAPDEAFYSLGQLSQQGWPQTEEDSADVYPTKEMRNYTGIPSAGHIPDSLATRLIHGYYAAVSFIDDMVGRVLDGLEKEGLAENTIVVLIGDHGWQLGEHGLWCKHCNFRNVLQTPLLISVPWLKKRHTTDALAELVDIYPTLLELCALDQPGHLEGNSLVPILLAPDQEIKDAVFLRYLAGSTIITKRYAYTEWYDRDQQFMANMLYDLVQDPMENVNLSGESEYRELIQGLRERLIDTWPELGK